MRSLKSDCWIGSCGRPLAAVLAGALLLSWASAAQAQVLRRPRRGPATSTPAPPPQITGELGTPSATTTISGRQLPAARSEIRRGDQGQCPAIEGLVGAANRAA